MNYPALLDYVEEVVGAYAADKRWPEQQIADTLAEAKEVMRRHPDPRLKRGQRGVRVYVILDQRGPVKVGISNNPSWRLYALSAGNPGKLGLIYQTREYPRDYAMAVEAAAHDYLAPLSLGREWFDCDVEKALEAIHIFGGLAE